MLRVGGILRCERPEIKIFSVGHGPGVQSDVTFVLMRLVTVGGVA